MKAKRPYHKRRKRLGIGPGSGHGKTSTKGHKGQRARSGFTMRPGFEGGQTPLYRRLPKRGFNQAHHKSYAIVNLDQLDRLEVSEVTPNWLIENRVVGRLGDGVKVLGRGELKRKLTVQAHRFSARAKEAIEKAGGQAILIGKNVTVQVPRHREEPRPPEDGSVRSSADRGDVAISGPEIATPRLRGARNDDVGELLH